jgi:hypothetical protein
MSGEIELIAKIKPKNDAFTGIVDAAQVLVDTTKFNNNLGGGDGTVQKALETLDDLIASGGGSGTAGASGYSGATGLQGVSGYSGINGVNGTVGTSGYSGAIGATGLSGYSGVNGVQGLSGYSGLKGETGGSEYNVLYATRMQNFNIHGSFTPFVGTQRWYNVFSSVITEARVYIGEASGDTIIVDIKKNGVSILGEQTLQLIATNFISSAITLDIPMDIEDYVTVDVVSGNGKDLTVRIKYRLI